MKTSRRFVSILVSAFALFSGSALAAGVERVEVPVRGKSLTVAIYRPAMPLATARGTIIMGSGDVGWVGLAVAMAEFLSGEGYIVAGINVRRYLSAFTDGQSHLVPSEEASDYAQLAAYLKGRDLLPSPVIVSGVSEGAALAVLAASADANHPWITGVITMGLPTSAELTWRWSDFTTWITKRDSSGPSFAPREFVGSVSPLPLCMIQSTRDEYVTEAGYRDLEESARQPKNLVLIDANNHRFSNRIPDLRRQFLLALAAIASRSSCQ